MRLVKKSTVVFKTIAPADLCPYIKLHPKVILLDVRTKDEFTGKSFPDLGTLKNAINIPIQELGGRLNELKAFKNSDGGIRAGVQFYPSPTFNLFASYYYGILNINNIDDRYKWKNRQLHIGVSVAIFSGK